MTKEVLIKMADIGCMNPKTRLGADNLAREFEAVVKLFNGVLQYKERERLILETRIKDLDKRIDDNRSKLNVLKINLNIYDQNDERISSGLIELEHNERSVKSKYEAMLTGESSADELGGLVSKRMPVQKKVTYDIEDKLIEKYSGHGGRDSLIQRRRRYLEDLDNTFRKFDEELFAIDGVRTNLYNARSEIQHKRDKALNSKVALEANYDGLIREKKELEENLDHSVQEESYILREYRELIGPISGHLEIRPEIDQMLMNLNSSTSAEKEPPRKNEPGKACLKIVENPLRVAGI